MSVLGNFGASVAMPSSASAQDLLRHKIPGRVLGSNKRLRIRLSGTVTTTASILQTVTLTIHYGAQSFVIASGISLLTLLSSAPFLLIVEIVADNSTTKQFADIILLHNITALSTTTPRLISGEFTQNSDTPIDVAVTVAFPGVISLGTTITRRTAIVEVIG